MRSIFPIFISLFVILLVVLSRRPATLLRRRGAISPDTAQPLDDLRSNDRRRLDLLVRQGVIREAGPGRYYHDLAGERARMRRKMPWMIALIIVLAIIAIAFGVWEGRRGVRGQGSGPNASVVAP
jgi:hypothetical protein